MLILQCILGLKSQSIEFKKTFAQADITSGKPVFIELTSDLKNYGGQCDVVIRLKKSQYGKSEAAHLWYENLRNGF